jgi:hypothetical protein
MMGRQITARQFWEVSVYRTGKPAAFPILFFVYLQLLRFKTQISRLKHSTHIQAILSMTAESAECTPARAQKNAKITIVKTSIKFELEVFSDR